MWGHWVTLSLFTSSHTEKYPFFYFPLLIWVFQLSYCRWGHRLSNHTNISCKKNEQVMVDFVWFHTYISSYSCLWVCWNMHRGNTRKKIFLKLICKRNLDWYFLCAFMMFQIVLSEHALFCNLKKEMQWNISNIKSQINSKEPRAFCSRCMLSFGTSKTELALTRIQNAKAKCLGRAISSRFSMESWPFVWVFELCVCQRTGSWGRDREELNSSSPFRGCGCKS